MDQPHDNWEQLSFTAVRTGADYTLITCSHISFQPFFTLKLLFFCPIPKEPRAKSCRKPSFHNMTALNWTAETCENVRVKWRLVVKRCCVKSNLLHYKFTAIESPFTVLPLGDWGLLFWNFSDDSFILETKCIQSKKHFQVTLELLKFRL